MRTFEEKKQARVERLKAKAEKAKERAQNHREYSDSLTACIPFGQPILVGHHSEKAHRNRIERSQNHMFKMVEENNKAQEYERKASAAEKNNAIYTEDPEALQKLNEKLEKLEAERTHMKAVNNAWRKYAKKGDDSALKQLGFDNDGINKLETSIENAYSWEKQPFPKWQLSNLGANIRNVKKRIETLKKNEQRETSSNNWGKIRMVENAEENRIQLFFPDKPSEANRRILKQNGFRWSKYNGCWQCYFNNHGIWRTQTVLKQIGKDYA